MKTNLKVVLTAVAIKAVASPVMAQSGLLTVSPENWQRASDWAQHVTPLPANAEGARGSASHSESRHVPAAVRQNGAQIRLDDCVHVDFPQCGDDAMRSQF